MEPIVQFIGYMSTLIGFLITLVAFGNKIRDIAEGQQCQLRNDITAIYYKHCDEAEPTLREYERQNLDSIFAAYKALKGNNYVDDLYNQMRRWKVVK